MIIITTWVLTSSLPITQRIFFPFWIASCLFFLICGRESLYHFRRASKDLLRLTLFWFKPLSFSYGNYVTWDQAQFSFRFVNNILADKAKRKESLIQTFYKTSAAHFFDWLTFAESANQNYFHCLFFSM